RISLNERRGGHPNAPGNQEQTRGPAEPWAATPQFLEEHEGGEKRDPGKIHDAEYEQERHEGPAAEQAISPMTKAHHEGTEPPFAPLAHYKGQWAAAFVEAGKLERRELIKPRRDQNRSAPP